MEKICKTCKKVFIPKDDRPTRPAKFCSRKCNRSGYKFKKGHIGFIPPRHAWDNKNSKKTRFGAGQISFFKKGHIPWNKNKDFGSTELLAKRISWLILYRKWKKLIKKRDGYKCVRCRSKNNLNIDHYPISLSALIRKYNVKKPQEAKRYKKFWDIKNGRILCLVCHKKTKTYGRNFVQKM